MSTNFQKAMDATQGKLNGVICYLDDILIISKRNHTSHNEKVKEVMKRLRY